MPFNEPVDDRIQRKLVASGVHAELERLWQLKFADSERDDAEVFSEFYLELCEISLDPAELRIKP